jgi:hypothetical protein
MSLKTFAATLVLALSATAAQLPELRIEPVAGATVFYLKNVSTQPLTAYIVELVGYPGSAFTLLQDVSSEPIPAGVEKRLQVTDMTAGAAPEYVKVQGAIYADGSSAGVPQKVTQIVEYRRSMLGTTRELLGRLEKAKTAGTAKAAVVADLKQWAGTMQPPARHDRLYAPAAVNQSASRRLIESTATKIDTSSLDEALSGLHASESALASAKPAL